MHYCLNFIQIVAILIIIIITTRLSSGNQPSYQVSLYVQLQPQKPPIHICNGVIVQSRLILTTASCLHNRTSPDGPVVIFEPDTISVISGSTTKYHKELTLRVADIFIADKFNYTTSANDLALLRLNGILPLDARSDMTWITLDDDKEYDDPCLVNFFERNSPQGTLKYIQTEQMPILNSDSCRVSSNSLIERKNDICSLYYIPMDFNCSQSYETVENYVYNGDRGTGLLCGNKLVGLLSTILPWQNASDCKDRTLKAYFTAVGPHINWIFSILTEEDLTMFSHGQYISSSPYAGETNAVIETQGTEIVTHNNSAAMFERINWCWPLSGILAIIYITAYLY